MKIKRPYFENGGQLKTKKLKFYGTSLRVSCDGSEIQGYKLHWTEYVSSLYDYLNFIWYELK